MRNSQRRPSTHIIFCLWRIEAKKLFQNWIFRHSWVSYLTLANHLTPHKRLASLALQADLTSITGWPLWYYRLAWLTLLAWLIALQAGLTNITNLPQWHKRLAWLTLLACLIALQAGLTNITNLPQWHKRLASLALQAALTDIKGKTGWPYWCYRLASHV